MTNLRSRLRRLRGVGPRKLVWIVGFGRSGTGWLTRMLREARGDAVWNEPGVGSLFGDPYIDKVAERRPPSFILSSAHREVWLRAIRSLILEGASARYPHLARHQCLIVKEPWGSKGVPLLSEALPESRLIFLLRDPRDVMASALDAQRAGSWIRKIEAERGVQESSLADRDATEFVRQTASAFRDGIELVHSAFGSHRGPKSFLRYEDLHATPRLELERVCRDVDLAVRSEGLERAVELNHWDRLPEEHKGAGRPFRKGRPGAFIEDLSEEQVALVEDLAAPVLRRFYADRMDGP